MTERGRESQMGRSEGRRRESEVGVEGREGVGCREDESG